MKTVRALAVLIIAALVVEAAGGADVLAELPPEVEEPLLELPEEEAEEFAVAEGTAKPVILPENGPGGAEALAPTPTRLGEGAPGMVGVVFIAACWNVANTSGDALIVL